jgi:hypothetical protein
VQCRGYRRATEQKPSFDELTPDYHAAGTVAGHLASETWPHYQITRLVPEPSRCAGTSAAGTPALCRPTEVKTPCMTLRFERKSSKDNKDTVQRVSTASKVVPDRHGNSRGIDQQSTRRLHHHTEREARLCKAQSNAGPRSGRVSVAVPISTQCCTRCLSSGGSNTVRSARSAIPTIEMSFPDPQALLRGNLSMSYALTARGTVLSLYRMQEMTPPQCTDASLDVLSVIFTI